MHEPVGRVHFVVFEKFISAYLFQIAREKSFDYLLIMYTKKKLYIVHSTDWLEQTTTFVKFKLFQDQRFQNHSAENLEMCKDFLIWSPAR